MKSRVVLLFVGLGLMWTLLFLRAFDLQILPDDRLAALQSRQFQTVVTLQARRGAIIDRSGRDLALSSPATSIYADPRLITAPRGTSQKLARYLGLSWENLFFRLKDKSKRFVWVQRFLDPLEAEKVKSLKLKGISFVEEWKRIYPNDSLLSQTLGFVGIEGQGLEGLELQYDNELKGNKRKVTVRRDARGRPLMADGLLFTENPDGNEIQLTVDSELQYALENELKQAIHEFEANSAVGVILDAETSAIRALASAPTFDVNRWNKTPGEVKRNRVITDAFEPGSTMKAFVVAAGLQKQILQPNSKYFCEWGQMKVADRTIRESDSKHKFGFLTVTEILAFSSNIGVTKIAFQMGDEILRGAYSLFGFGQKLGVDLPGEAKGTLHGTPWGPHLLSNISFGQGVTATSLQLAAAYASLVNGGVLRSPYIVDSVRDAESGQLEKKSSQVIRQVLTPEESEKMRLMLMSVTNDEGTGVKARVNGFLVGGKTGTAQKVSSTSRGYSPQSYISSFAGFIPAHHPKFVIYVAVDEPRKAFYGSQVAAPVFSRLASYAVRREGLAPMILSDRNLLFKGNESKPKADSALFTSLDFLKESNAAELKQIPELKSLTVREVLREMNGKPFEVKFVGQGRVVETEPPAGSEIPESKKITVFLK